MKRARFALDEDFPDTILAALGLGVPEASLVPLREIHPALVQVDDWEMLLGLRNLAGWDGLITMDTSMLHLPRELAVIHQTKLTVVAIDEAGHDPVRAVGLLLTHLPVICRKTVRTKGQVWILRHTAKNHEDPWDLLKGVAKHQNVDAQTLYRQSRLTKAQLASNPLIQHSLES